MLAFGRRLEGSNRRWMPREAMTSTSLDTSQRDMIGRHTEGDPKWKLSGEGGSGSWGNLVDGAPCKSPAATLEIGDATLIGAVHFIGEAIAEGNIVVFYLGSFCYLWFSV